MDLHLGFARWQNHYGDSFTCSDGCTASGRGKRNLENDQEMTVRTNITHVLNLAQDVKLGLGGSSWSLMVLRSPHADLVKLVTEYNQERGLPFVYEKLHFGNLARTLRSSSLLAAEGYNWYQAAS